LALLIHPMSLRAADQAPPKVGDRVADFELPSLAGGTVKLSEVVKQGPTAVIVLRGFPGYQCPLCRKQVQAFTKEAAGFEEVGARVLLIYPGDVNDLAAKAKEFLGAQELPEGFQLLIDPGYSFTNAWNLRWDAPKETAYPSTFVIDKDLKVKMAKVSDSHGGRTAPADVLKSLSGGQ
ncbi:MAG: peroxiredoxin family protein, partial [Planctomycetaceae bacterium]